MPLSFQKEEEKPTSVPDRTRTGRHFDNNAVHFPVVMRHRAYQSAPLLVPPLPGGDRIALERFLGEVIASLTSAAFLQLHYTAISQSRWGAETARAVYTLLRAPWLEPIMDWLVAIGLRRDVEWHARQLLVLAIRVNRLFAGGQAVSTVDRRRYARRAVAILSDGLPTFSEWRGYFSA